jgi:hypothetical protein
MKIVINRCHGGFGISHEAILKYAEYKNFKLFYDKSKENSWFLEYFLDEEQTKPFRSYNIPRNDPDLIKIIEQLGEKSFGSCAKLKIVEVPDKTNWEIDEYNDGYERVVQNYNEWD